MRRAPRRRGGVVVVALLAVFGLGACGAGVAVPGSSEYSCAGRPEGVVCRSTRDIYALTEERDRVHEADLAQPVGDGAGGRPIRVAADGVAAPGAAVGAPAASAAAVATPREGVIAMAPPAPVAVSDPIAFAAARAGGPRRLDARVVRIWIAPWQDQRGDLRMPGHVYAEVHPRSWSFGGEPPQAPASNLLMTPEMIRARETEATPPAGAPLTAPAAAPGPAPADPPRRGPAFDPPRTVEVRS
jgi:conjugal transfer pilus assembly protein TraV